MSSTAQNGRPAPRAAHRPAPARPSSTASARSAPAAGPDAAGPDAAGPGSRGPARQSLGSALQQLLVVAVDRLAGAAADTIDGLAGKLDGIATSGGTGGGGVLAQAALQGGLAYAQGRNPVWAALRAGVSAMSVPAKVGLALLLIVTAVLAPVLVLVLAVALLVAAVVGAVAS